MGQILTNLVGNSHTTTNLRTNETVSVAMCDFVCLIEIAMMHINWYAEPLTVVCTNVKSRKHACMTKLVFDILYETVFIHTDVDVYMFVPTNIYTFMTRAFTVKAIIHVHVTSDCLTDMKLGAGTSRNTKILVVIVNNT